MSPSIPLAPLNKRGNKKLIAPGAIEFLWRFQLKNKFFRGIWEFFTKFNNYVSPMDVKVAQSLGLGCCCIVSSMALRSYTRASVIKMVCSEDFSPS